MICMKALNTTLEMMENIEPGDFQPEVAGGPDGGELSFAQQRLWFMDQMEPQRATYNIPLAIELDGSLDVSCLERALSALVGRHESLRTTFVLENGQPRQLVSEPGFPGLTITDLKRRKDARKRLEGLLREEASTGFDLGQGPLFRARLYRLAADEHVLLLTMHHIVSDGWSVGVLLKELGVYYEHFREGAAEHRPAPAVRYRDFARWQRNQLRGENIEKLLSFWRIQLQGAPQVLELPADRPRPAVESNRGAEFSCTLPPELVDSLRRLASREKATLFMPLLAGFATLLSRYTGEADFLLGTPIANRNRAEFEGVVGCFVNTLVLRANLSGDPAVNELVRRMRRVCLDAFQNQDLPFERLVEEMQPERDLSRNPLVQVMFSLENMPLTPLQLAGVTSKPLEVVRGVAHVDLTLRAHETREGLRAVFEYATDLFHEATIERMAGHWRRLLEAMVASPEGRVSELPLLGGPERRQLLVEWNQTTADYPHEAGVHELFVAQAKKTPDAIAVSFGDQQITYAELDRRSTQLAAHLSKLGAGPGTRVGICLERSLEIPVGLLAILKTGAAYVPLDPSFPEERLRFMAENTRIAALVTTSAVAPVFRLPRERQVLLDADAQVIASTPDKLSLEISNAAHTDEPAYVIYTSGSTGKPKGVIVPHRAVVNFLTSMAREPGVTAGDKLVAVTTLSFDIAVLELFLPLVCGAQVVMANQEQILDGRALGQLLKQQGATVMQATPVTWRLLLEAGWQPLVKFKALVGGEALPPDLADELMESGVELWNMYGPTETTVWSTCTRLTDKAAGITIGKPIANTTARILDARMNLCPIGVPGELFIGGTGLSQGYWLQPELTADRFIRDPFGEAPGDRLYRTGDRARWRADGSIEHLGRMDRQVKLRGFRIEPAEIETVLAQHPGVHEVAVALRDDHRGGQRLVAWVVPANPVTGLEGELRARARSTMPEYMIPSHFVLLEALPRTPNGKLDYQVLPAPVLETGATRTTRVAPRTATEQLVLEAFQGVLLREDADVSDNFFDLGGHSLMAARLMARLQETTRLPIPMRLLFEYPTPAALAKAVDGLRWLQESESPATDNDVGRREEINV
jgi:amino acid adenylation domain-containing protein